MGVWVLTTPILKNSLGENDITENYPRKVVMNVVLMFGS